MLNSSNDVFNVSKTVLESILHDEKWFTTKLMLGILAGPSLKHCLNILNMTK